jgi:hypothetical protein
LLEYPNHQKQRDGAVTMALLATECALKAALMHGFQLNTTSDADEAQISRWFRGKKGHNLQVLWSDQAANLRAQVVVKQDDALSRLNQADPYVYRYGQKKPKREHAEPFIEDSEVLVQWTESVVGIAP